VCPRTLLVARRVLRFRKLTFVYILLLLTCCTFSCVLSGAVRGIVGEMPMHLFHPRLHRLHYFDADPRVSYVYQCANVLVHSVAMFASINFLYSRKTIIVLRLLLSSCVPFLHFTYLSHTHVRSFSLSRFLGRSLSLQNVSLKASQRFRRWFRFHCCVGRSISDWGRAFDQDGFFSGVKYETFLK